MPRGTTARTVASIGGIVVCVLGLAPVAAGAIVMAKRDKALGLALVGGGFALVVVGGLLTSPQRARAEDTPPSGKA